MASAVLLGWHQGIWHGGRHRDPET